MSPCWIVTISALDGSNAAKTLRFSDGEYIDGSNNGYIKRLNKPALVTVSPNDGGTLKIFSSASIGEVELNNMDGGLNYLADYAIDGQSFNQSYFNGISVISYFDGTCLGKRDAEGKVYISLRTLKDTLDTDHPQTIFAGNNSLPAGTEGVATDIKGNVKPRGYGKNLEQAGVCVNTSKLIYLFSARSSSIVDNVYVPGQLTRTAGGDYTSLADMEANAPAAGFFKAYKGYARLGASPIGTVTSDTHDASNLAGDVFKAICDERSIATDSASITALNAVGEVGLVIDSTRSTGDMLNELVKGLFVYYYFISSTIYVKKFALATVSTFDVYDMPDLRQCEKLERKATGIGANGLPIWSIKMQCDQVLTVQKNLDGTAIPLTRLSRISNQWRKVEDTNSACLTRHPLSGTLKLDSCIRNVSDAQTIVTNALAILSARIDWVSVTVHYTQLPAIVIGAGFTLYSDQLGYNSGRIMTIIDYELDAENSVITLGAVG